MNDKMRDICTICYDSIKKDEDNKVTTHCNHHFHLNCIKIWLTYNNISALCKQHQTTKQIIKMTGENIKVKPNHKRTHKYIQITLAMTLREQGGTATPGWPSTPIRDYDEQERRNSRFGDEYFQEWDQINHILQGKQKLWQQKRDRIANVNYRNSRIALWKSQNNLLGKDISNTKFEGEHQIDQLKIELEQFRTNKAKEEEKKLEIIKQEKSQKENQQKMTDQQVRKFVEDELTRIYTEKYMELMKKINS